MCFWGRRELFIGITNLTYRAFVIIIIIIIIVVLLNSLLARRRSSDERLDTSAPSWFRYLFTVEISVTLIQLVSYQIFEIPFPADSEPQFLWKRSLLLVFIFQADELDDKLIFQLSFSSRGSFPPLAASLGGIVGQEVLKALTGKYTPLRQWVRRKLGRNVKVSCRVLFSRNSLSAQKKAISTQIWRRVQNSNLQQIQYYYFCTSVFRLFLLIYEPFSSHQRHKWTCIAA